MTTVDFVERIAFPQKMTVGILDGIVVSKQILLHINNLNYWETWTMFRLRDFSFVILVAIVSPFGSITPVSLHNKTISYVHCMRVAVPCVPNSISPLSMQMLCCQDWQDLNPCKILDTVCLDFTTTFVYTAKRTNASHFSEGTQVWTFGWFTGI